MSRSLFTVKRDGSEFRVLVRPPTGGGQWVYRYTQFLAALQDGSDDILVVANDAHERFPDVYRLNTDTGRRTLRSLGKPGDVVRWVVDRKGAVRAAVTEEKEGGGRVYWRPAESAPWEKIDEFAPHGQQIVPVGFDGDGSLIVASRSGRDRMALYRFDPEKKTLGELLAAHPQVDLAGGLVYDRTKERVVGVAYNADRPGVAWFDEDWARVAAMVDGALPNHFNVLEIPGWLTLPKGTDAKNLPLIVLVHGGPWVHGAGWRWNSEAAFLGSLGYAVLEPEFRGSTGWGWKHYRASFKQWGRAMQDDLDDGMDWLVKQGTVDPKRACIMGASYGGYAVMMGLARDPDRWRCGIDVVGVTDINLMYDVAWSDIANSTFIKYTAKDMLGDQVADAAQLKATSPIAQAARVRSPVLMAYGANDRRVPLIHGEKMRDALRARDVPVTHTSGGNTRRNCSPCPPRRAA